MTTQHCRYGDFSVPDHNDLIFEALRQYGEWAQKELDMLGLFVHPGDAVLDVGAFIGTHARAFSQMVGAQGIVHAFEPNERSYCELLKNAQLAPHANIRAYRFALGDQKRLGFVIQDETLTNLGASRLSKDNCDGGMASVEVKILDSLDFIRVDFIKADVEGMEYSVLVGGMRTIRQHKPIIFLEVNSLQTSYQIVDWAHGMDYVIYGDVRSAFNPENFKRSTINMFGEARECGMLLIHRDQLKSWDATLSSLRLPVIETIDDIALLLLHKPQYVQEVLGGVEVCGQISGLNQTAAERDEQIASLSQAVTERDGQIASLSQAVTERDGQIASLSQAVTDRDGQIASLSQAVTERDGQIASLNQAVTEREELIHRIIRSRSWRLTKPARFIGRLLRGDVDGSLALFRQLLAKLKNRRVDEALVCDSNTRPVAIVLPVYKGVQMTLDCIDSAMPGILDVSNAKLIIINDASPDSDMQDALKETVERWPHVIQLLLNDSNLGFVASVNKGMRIYPEHDIVLLNSDVVLPTGWLKRLRKEAYSRPNVATVTPISNNTTICTFPEFLQDNQIPFGLSVQDVDNVFSLQEMPSVEAPTGIGFCMYIRRNALNRVGYFNEERFGRGYGEENDFCQRAIKSGYVNLISPNIYVYHQGGVSFGADKEALVENAMKVIDELHPNYHADVQAFIAADPLRNARISRFAALIAAVKLPKILHVSHGIGGGVDQHIDELSEFCDGRAISLLLVPGDRESFVEIRLGCRKTSDRLFFDLTQQNDELLSFLRRLSVSLIHYHHVLRLHPSLLDLPSAMPVNHALTVHDFFLLNGNPTLTDESGVFAGHYNDKFFNPLYPLPDGLTPEQWRETYRQLVETAKVVIFPSQSTMTIFGNHYAIARPIVAYHPECARKLDRPLKGIEKKNRYTVGVIGAISKEKGADLLEKIAMLAKSKRLPLDFVLIGYAYRPLRGLKTTGPYNADMLQYLLLENQIDVCFFPARCPETYSYTLSYAFESGLPIVAPRLGAFPERLAGRESVLLFDHLETPEAILGEINSFIEKIVSGVPPRCPVLPVTTALTDFYGEEYLSFCTKLTDFDEKWTLNIPIRPVPLGKVTRREKILSVLWKIYSHRAMRWVNSIIPFRFRRAVKRSLSRKPMHEISGR